MPTDPEKKSPDPDEDEVDTTNTKDVDPGESEAKSGASREKAKSARRDRPRRHDDEEEDERPRRRKTKRKRPKRPLPRTEAEINAPDMQTLWMLGSVAVMVLIMWGGARFACNAHPDETRKPREITTAEISIDPKGAAIELAQRWATKKFDAALELATGSLAVEIQREKSQCESNPQCSAERDALEDKVLTTGDLLTRQPTTATVRVTSTGMADGPRSFVLELNAEGKNWKANARQSANAPSPSVPTDVAPAPAVPPSASAPPAPPAKPGAAPAKPGAAPVKPAAPRAKPAAAPATPAPAPAKPAPAPAPAQPGTAP